MQGALIPVPCLRATRTRRADPTCLPPFTRCFLPFSGALPTPRSAANLLPCYVPCHPGPFGRQDGSRARAAGAATVSGLCSSLCRKHHAHTPHPLHRFLPHPSDHPPGRTHRCAHGRGGQPPGGGDGAGCVAGGAVAGGAAGAGGGCGGYGQSGGAGESARRA